MSRFHTQGVQSLIKTTGLVMGLALGGHCALAQEAQGPDADPGAALEQMLATLAAQREARSTEAAEQAFAAADRIVNQPALEGFARAFQHRIAEHAAALGQQLASVKSDEQTLTATTNALHDAIADYRDVATFPPMRIIEATPGSFNLTADTQPQWADGLLANVQASDEGLVLSDDQVVELQGEANFVETTLLTRSLPEDDQVTISLWLFPTSISREMAIIEGNTVGKFDRWQLTFSPQQQVALRNEGPHSTYARTPVGTVPVGRWTHVAMTFGRGDQILPALYVNGLLAARQREHRDYPLRSKGDKPIRFGSDYQRFPESHFMLRQVRIWRGMRMAEQIQDDMFEQLTGNEPDLIGHWPLDEGQGTTAHDRSANARHGKMQGGRWSPRVQQGQRLAQPIKLHALGAVDSSRLSWQVGSPDQDEQAVVMAAGLSDRADVLPAQWHTVTNGGELAVFQSGQLPGERYLWLRQTLRRPDRHARSPVLKTMRLEIHSK